MTNTILKQKQREYDKQWRINNPDKTKAHYKKWYEKNKEKVLAKQKQRNLENPEKRYLTNRKSDLRKYGITLEQYEQLEKKQKGVCAICGNKNQNKKLDVDHCHKTGKVRGLLCSNCNNGLGKFKDDKTLLNKAIKYL